MERMPQLEAEIPDPLRKNEPKLLAPGGVRTPAVRLLYSKPLWVRVMLNPHGKLVFLPTTSA